MVATSEHWVERLILEKADLEVKCLALKRFLNNNSAGVINKGDNMYSAMEDQLEAMMSYKNSLELRIELIWRR